ncbi:nitroreductase family protein [Clostridium sp. PL3]|uniref:Nitroreductase family protein n=1 Tax=Clostridium thailandense TaxID=2794346 RepID=A0A949TV83_9CLOT|nr:nitroreductase family protein [Clostridium thailandense]
MEKEKMNSAMPCILNRRSVRAYTSEEVSKDAIIQMLTAANWAPSGNNMQP